jgi:pyridoxamine 5'-phosphate oxidase
LNPIQKIQNDRAKARKLGDTNADICFLALTDSDGRASVRTLVLRDIIDNRFTLFINKTSPKWQALSSGASYELLLWYSSMQRQYRISGSAQALDTEIVKTNWQRRPIGSKYLDYVYEELGNQSSVISSREILTNKIIQLKGSQSPDDMVTPPMVAGIELVATKIEALDLNMEDKIHDRQVYRFDGTSWTSEILIP